MLDGMRRMVKVTRPTTAYANIPSLDLDEYRYESRLQQITSRPGLVERRSKKTVLATVRLHPADL